MVGFSSGRIVPIPAALSRSRRAQLAPPELGPCRLNPHGLARHRPGSLGYAAPRLWQIRILGFTKPVYIKLLYSCFRRNVQDGRLCCWEVETKCRALDAQPRPSPSRAAPGPGFGPARHRFFRIRKFKIRYA